MEALTFVARLHGTNGDQGLPRRHVGDRDGRGLGDTQMRRHGPASVGRNGDEFGETALTG